MKLSIAWHDDKFNIEFTRPNEDKAFLSIKGCKIVEGKSGPFISMPSSPKKSGGFWNHAWADEKFQSAVMQMARPLAKAPPKPAPKVQDHSGFDTMQSDVPY